jgi:GT2 family glycosyltransferase
MSRNGADHASQNPDAAPADATGIPEITAVICTHNRYDVLADAIASLRGQSIHSSDLEILVVDNSTDFERQSEYWNNREMPENARLLFDSKPGLSRARNFALREARAPLIAYLDDDAVAAADWCASLVQVFRDRPDAGIVGGPVEPVWESAEPNWLHRWQRGFLSIVDFGDSLRALDHGEWLAGTNISFRTAVLEKIGGFDEGLGRIGPFLLSNEELVVSRKILELGYRSYYTPDARMMHRVGGARASQQWLRQRACWQIVSDLLANNERLNDRQCWGELATYFERLPLEFRSVRGLFLDVEDSNSFYLQCRALGALMHLMLNQARDPEPE